MKKRKIKRYRNTRRNSGVKFIGIIGIMVLAIVCGYLTARFVIAPLLGYDTEVLKLNFPSKLTALTDREDKAEDETEKDEEKQNETQSETEANEQTDTGEDAGADSDLDSDKDSVKDADSDSDKDSDTDTDADTEPEKSETKSGYVLQFGVFSTRKRAEELRYKLKNDGISTEIRKAGDRFKVTGELFSTKEEAVAELKATKTGQVTGIFIAVIK